MGNEKENKLVYVNENGDEVLCEVLFTFADENFGKNYVLFYEIGSEDEEGSIQVMAASYTELEDGTVGELNAIETDEEWEVVEQMLEEYTENYDEECDCDDCDCDVCDGEHHKCHSCEE